MEICVSSLEEMCDLMCNNRIPKGAKKMSLYSDHKVGALTDEEFDRLAAEENRRERIAWEHERDYIDDFERMEYEEGDDEDDV